MMRDMTGRSGNKDKTRKGTTASLPYRQKLGEQHRLIPNNFNLPHEAHTLGSPRILYTTASPNQPDDSRDDTA